VKEQIFYFIRVVIARAYPRLIGAQRELSWILGDTLLPFLSVAGYVLVYRAMRAPETYTGFVVLGGVMVAFWASMLWGMGMQLFWEKETGNLARYLMTPMSRPAMLLGMAIGGAVTTAIRVVVIPIAAYLMFGITFPFVSVWLSVLVFFLTLAALYGMGMALSSLFFMAGRAVNYGLQLMYEPIFFLGGFTFPVKLLGTFVAGAAAALIPVTLGLDALRQTMLGAADLALLPVSTEVILLTAMAVVFITLSVWLIRVLEDMGRRHGKLILQNQ